MWLDRLAGASSNASGSSTPQPGSRPYSPAPRRSSSNLSPYVTSQRPGVTPRGSTLSLVSNESTGSLLGSSRRVNGSGLKQTTVVMDDGEPLEALRQLLGSPEPKWSGQDAPLLDDLDIDAEYDFEGLSLREVLGASQRSSDARPIQDSAELSKYEDLHTSISACDDLLNSVETNLTQFRNDLASVSSDIETLQARSTLLNIRLENRIAVEKALGPVVEELSVSPVVVSRIADGPMDEFWVKTLGDLDRRIGAYRASTSNPRQSKAWEDLGPLLEKLVLKAVERIRDYLVAQIKALRSPHINAQVIQQQSFLKYRELFAFLHRHHATLAEEICQAYLNTMRWYYSHHFLRYEKALSKMKLHVLDKNDVIGHEDAPRKTGVLSSAKTAAPPHDAFSLGRRIGVLRAGDQNALPSYLAEEDQSTHYFEVPFRNFNLALIDNAAAEYTFLAGFFSPPYSFGLVSRHFKFIFEPIFLMGQNLTKSLVGDSYDTLGLLLCVRLNQQLEFELQRRKVPAVISYIDATRMLLWPRLQFVMGAHCDSIRHLKSGLGLGGSSRSAGDHGKLSTAPHLLVQRFGQLLQGVLSLSGEATDDEPVVASFRRLRAELEAFLARYCGAFGADKRKAQRFLYNNYSLILTIISDTGGRIAEEEQEHFEKLKNSVADGT